MKNRLENAIEEYGEVMIRTDSGEEHELHKHNVEFEDDLITAEAEDRVHWLNPEKIERYWIHKDF